MKDCTSLNNKRNLRVHTQKKKAETKILNISIMSTSTIGEMIELENHHQITIMVIRDSFKNQNIFSDVKLSLKLFGIYFVRNRTFIYAQTVPPEKNIYNYL